MLLWTGAVLGGLILLVVIGVFILLRSQSIHGYVLRTAQLKASTALGSQVRFRDFDLKWSGISPTLELRDIAIDSPPPFAGTSLLRADLVRLAVTVSSLWHRSWYVNDVEIRRPVLRIAVAPNGQNNLPHPQNQSPSGSRVDVFELGVRHISLQGGEIYYNDQKSDLSADLHELAVQIAFAVTSKEYSGSLSYKDGHVQWSRNEPLPHNLDAHFSVTAARFVLKDTQLTSGRSRVLLRGSVEDFARPKIDANYEAAVETGELRGVFKSDSVPVGVLFASGEVHYQNDPSRPLLTSATLRGETHSNLLTVTRQGRSLRLSGFGANYGLSSGNLRVTDVRGRILGGEIAGEATIRDVANSQLASAKASLRNIPAAAVQEFAASPSRANVHVSGTVNATANASWRKSLADLVASTEFHIAAAVQSPNGNGNVPLNGLLRARYNGRSATLAILGQSYLRTPRTSLSLQGSVGKQSSLRAELQSSDLNEFEQIANAFQANPIHLNLHGQATAVATVSGSTTKPQAKGQINLSGVRVRNAGWKSLRTQFAVSPDSVALTQGEIVPAGRGRITFQLSSGLQQWASLPSSPLLASIHGSNLDLKQLAAMAGNTAQVSGNLNINAEVRGTRLAPVGDGTLHVANAVVANEPVRSLTAGFQANGTDVAAQAKVDIPAGIVNAELHYQPKQQAYDVAVRSSGVKLEELESIRERNVQLTGTLLIDASGHGTLDNPGLQATLKIPELAVRSQTVRNIQLSTEVANHVAKFNLNSETAGTQAAAQGTIQLTGDYLADISVNTQVISLQPLFAMYAPAQAGDLSGQTELHATLRGPLKRKEQVEAHLQIPQLTLQYKNNIQLNAAAPIRADFVRGTLEVKRSSIRGTETDLNFQATIPVSTEAPASILLEGSVDLQLAQLLSPDITSGGQLRFDINSYGLRSDPAIQGQIKIVNAHLVQSGSPLGLSNGNGVLTLTRNRLDITEFNGQVGGGTVSASGGVVYRPSLSFDLAMKAAGVRMLYQQSVRATFNSDLAFTGRYEDASLRGQVSIEQLAFTSTFDLVEFAGQFGGGETTPPPTGGLSENVHLDVALETPGGLNMASRDLSLAGSANLRVQGTLSQPVVLGRVNLTDGDLIFYGNRYLVQRGTIDFRNPTQTEPIIDMSVNTTIQQYDIQMHIWGPADHLATNYSSDPALPPSDIINLIAFGKTAEAAAANPSPPGMLGAQSLVASQVSSQVTSRISKLAGISQLSVDPELGSSQQSAGARVAIQQRVTGKIFLTFSSDVTSTQQQIIQVEYRMNRRTSVKAVRDQNGGFSFQTSFRKDW